MRDWQTRLRDLPQARSRRSPRSSSGGSPASCPRTLRRVVDAFVAAQAAKAETVATRKASQQAIEAYAATLPEMIGGSADLTGSVFTNWSGSRTVTREAPGNYVYFGVREFAMAAIANGLALHGGFIPYHGTFLTFSDYMRNAVRMAALMKLRVDLRVHARFDRPGRGRTDAPVDRARGEPAPHPAARRLAAVRHRRDGASRGRPRSSARDGPSALLFTRQNVPFVAARRRRRSAAIRRGGYVLADFGPAPAARAR